MRRGQRNLAFDIIGLKGTRRNLETLAVPIPDPNGNGTVQLALTRDITDRKRMEEALRQSGYAGGLLPRHFPISSGAIYLTANATG